MDLMEMEKIASPAPNGDEIEVSHILLDLPDLIWKSEKLGSCSIELIRSPLRWVCKQRTSYEGSGRLVSQFPSPPPPPLEVSHGGADVPSEPIVKYEELSPNTPLSFPSESEEKPVNTSRKLSKKKTIEEWRAEIDELTQRRDTLEGELKNVRAYYDKLKAYNLELKAKIHLLEPEEPSLRILVPETSAAQQYHQYQNPIVVNPTGSRVEYQMVEMGPMQALMSSQIGLGPENHLLGPTGIPDLNVPAEESMGVMEAGPSQPFDLPRMEDDKKARYAEKRRIRMNKNKNKIKKRESGFSLDG